MSNTLSVEGSLQALKMALKNRKYKDQPLIHHSDRGLQYCSNYFQKLLNQHNISTSMTEKYDPYENAIAERVNSILKQEFNIHRSIKSFEVKNELIKNAVEIYNTFRPHYFNYMLTPIEIHSQNKLKRKQYKSKKLNDASIVKL